MTVLSDRFLVVFFFLLLFEKNQSGLLEIKIQSLLISLKLKLTGDRITHARYVINWIPGQPRRSQNFWYQSVKSRRPLDF